MNNILITGGAGDWAASFSNKFKHIYRISTPSRSELDVSNEDSVRQHMEENTYDIVINNAGSIHPKRILESDSRLWINDINVNLIGTYLTSKYALLKNTNTIIINISSTAGFNHYPDWSSYCSSKAAVITFTQCLANDNFHAFCLCPGGFDTKFRDNFSLNNDNLMSCDDISQHVVDVIDGKYNSGDVLFFRKGHFELNP